AQMLILSNPRETEWQSSFRSSESEPGRVELEGRLLVSEDTLQEVTQVAVVRHPLHGVLLLHAAARRWHFPDATLRVHESWRRSLRRGVVGDPTEFGLRSLPLGATTRRAGRTGTVSPAR